MHWWPITNCTPAARLRNKGDGKCVAYTHEQSLNIVNILKVEMWMPVNTLKPRLADMQTPSRSVHLFLWTLLWKNSHLFGVHDLGEFWPKGCFHLDWEKVIYTSNHPTTRSGPISESHTVGTDINLLVKMNQGFFFQLMPFSFNIEEKWLMSVLLLSSL